MKPNEGSKIVKCLEITSYFRFDFIGFSVPEFLIKVQKISKTLTSAVLRVILALFKCESLFMPKRVLLMVLEKCSIAQNDLLTFLSSATKNRVRRPPLTTLGHLTGQYAKKYIQGLFP